MANYLWSIFSFAVAIVTFFALQSTLVFRSTYCFSGVYGFEHWAQRHLENAGYVV